MPTLLRIDSGFELKPLSDRRGGDIGWHTAKHHLALGSMSNLEACQPTDCVR
jgi:hypothetical protein